MIRWSQSYEVARMLAISGEVTVGAVFPPCGTPRDSQPWVWRLWVNGDLHAAEGRAKTELAAKTALISAWRAFLLRADLTPTQPAEPMPC